MPVVLDLCLPGMGGLDSGRVELRHLRVFEAVARLKSFTQAADELTITQPALSRTIQQLEDALGVTLLDRSSRHVEATQAGRMFLDHVERVLAELERGFNAVRRQASIRLGFSWLLPDRWAQGTVALFERGTGTTVSLIRTDDALAAVQRGKIDVAVVHGHVTSTAVRGHEWRCVLPTRPWQIDQSWTGPRSHGGRWLSTQPAAPRDHGPGRPAKSRKRLSGLRITTSGSNPSPPTAASA